MRIGVDRVRGEPPAPPAADGGPLPPPRKTSGDDPRATTDKGVTDRAASEPTHEEATHRDGAILRIGVDRIRGVDEGGTPLTTRRRALTRPDRPARSDQVGTPMGFKKEVGAPLVTSIGGAVVVSRHPHVLVGARTDHHRKDVLAIIAADPSHPLRPLLDPSSLASGKPRFRRSPYGRQGTLDDWRRHPEDWESGHVRSRKSGDAEVLIVQTRYRNRTQNRFLEHSGTGGEVTRERAVVIGGIAIEYGSAMDLFDAGFINLSRKEMDELPTIEF